MHAGITAVAAKCVFVQVKLWPLKKRCFSPRALSLSHRLELVCQNNQNCLVKVWSQMSVPSYSVTAGVQVFND